MSLFYRVTEFFETCAVSYCVQFGSRDEVEQHRAESTADHVCLEYIGEYERDEREHWKAVD
jgi:hypothetical protein